MNDSELLKEFLEYYPDEPDKDKTFKSSIHHVSWESYFSYLTPKVRSLFEKNIKYFEEYYFFQGINCEFGLNSTPVDLKKAYSFYEEGVKHLDPLSIYRMYRIHLEDFYKFYIKRNKIYQWFFLFFSFAMSKYSSKTTVSNLISDINITNEINLYKEIYDPELIRFETVMLFIETNYQKISIKGEKLIFAIERDTITLIKSLILYFFMNSQQQETLLYLSLAGNMEATYKLACIYMKENKPSSQIQELFTICEQRKYYRSYKDYGFFLFHTMNDKKKAYNIFKEGAIHGNPSCFENYYYLELYFFNFEKFLSQSTPQNEKKVMLSTIINLIINCYSIKILYVFFDFIYILKLAHKHAKLQKEIQQYYGVYINEIVEYIETNINSESFSYYDYYIPLSIYYSYPFDPQKVPNSLKAYNCLYNNYVTLKNNLNKRYAFTFLYKYQKKMKQSNELSKTEKDLFSVTMECLNQQKNSELSVSLLYSVGKLYDKGIGTKENKVAAYIFYKKASEYETKTISNYPHFNYKKYKSKIKLQEDFFKGFSLAVNNFDLLGGNKCEKRECPICYIKSDLKMIIPCLHQICGNCFWKLNEKGICPICRGYIIMSV